MWTVIPLSSGLLGWSLLSTSGLGAGKKEPQLMSVPPPKFKNLGNLFIFYAHYRVLNKKSSVASIKPAENS